MIRRVQGCVAESWWLAAASFVFGLGGRGPGAGVDAGAAAPGFASAVLH